MKGVIRLLGGFLFLLSSFTPAFSQELQTDTNHTPIQFRRGIEIPPGYQSYEQKYQGKDLIEEKRRSFPLESTGIWTELNPRVPRVDYLGIYFVNKDTGWACGDLGTIIKTTDGGESWQTLQTNTTTPILKVRNYNGQLIIASGYDGLILRSTDGGQNWAQVASGVTGDLWGLEMINNTLGWACGNYNSLIKTTNGGISWEVKTIPGYNSDLWWIEFLNEDYGFISGNPGQVIKTTDGGESWQIMQTSVFTPLYSLDLIDSLHIAAAGYGGNHVYSSDAGESWEATPLYGLPNEDLNCVKYINIDTGYVLTFWTGMWKTTDRGESWQGVANTGEYELQFFPEELIGYAAGTGLTVTKADGDLNIWRKAILNDNFSDVFFTSEQKGFVLSRSLYKTTDSGITWGKVGGVPGGSDLLFLDSLTGFLGASSSIYKTTDGGESWYPTQGSNGAGKIFFISQTTGWAIHSNVIYTTTDIGENWFVQFNAPLSLNFSSITFIDSLSGWVSGTRPYKTTDGGTNWVQQTNPNIWLSDDVYFPNTDTGWIGKYSSINNSLFKTSDGGLNWTGVPEVVGARKFYFFPDPVHWLTIGFSRYYITNDYGNSWYEFTADVSWGLVSFNSVTNNLGYFVGGLGLILKYTDTTYVPVELKIFTAKVDSNNIILNWSTSSELNNRGFEVLRSPFNLYGKDTSVWWNIGFVEGKGTTTEQQFYTLVDKDLTVGKYQYRLKQIDFDGSFRYSDVVGVEIRTPSDFYLSQNYPNPFNPNTKISYNLTEDSKVTLKVFDVLGREIETLINKEMSSGYHFIDFNASRLASGIYFYQLRVEGRDGKIYNSIKKMVLIR